MAVVVFVVVGVVLVLVTVGFFLSDEYGEFTLAGVLVAAVVARAVLVAVGLLVYVVSLRVVPAAACLPPRPRISILSAWFWEFEQE